jgi:hypothetical protein
MGEMEGAAEEGYIANGVPEWEPKCPAADIYANAATSFNASTHHNCRPQEALSPPVLRISTPPFTKLTVHRS